MKVFYLGSSEKKEKKKSGKDLKKIEAKVC